MALKNTAQNIPSFSFKNVISDVGMNNPTGLLQGILSGLTFAMEELEKGTFVVAHKGASMLHDNSEAWAKGMR